MRPAHRGNRIRVTRRGKPIVHCCADFATLYGWLARAMMASDQQQHTLAAGDCLLKAPVDCRPGSIEIHAVKVEHAIGLNGSAPQLLVPTTVERLVGDRQGFRARRWRRTSRCRPWPNYDLLKFLGSLSRFYLAREWPDRGRHSRPQLGLFRAESTHAPPCPWGSGSAPRRWPTSRPRSPPPQGRHPRKYRTCWAP